MPLSAAASPSVPHTGSPHWMQTMPNVRSTATDSGRRETNSSIGVSAVIGPSMDPT